MLSDYADKHTNIQVKLILAQSSKVKKNKSLILSPTSKIGRIRALAKIKYMHFFNKAELWYGKS